MKDVNLRGLAERHGRSWLCVVNGLKIGDQVGMTLRVGDALVVCNGQVTVVDDSGVYAAVPRSTSILTSTHGLHGVWHGGIEINTGKPVRRGMLRHGASAHVIERYAGGKNCQVSGKVTSIIGDGFRVGGQWFDFGGRQDGTARKLTIIGGT